jgi:hypothetical protein
VYVKEKSYTGITFNCISFRPIKGAATARGIYFERIRKPTKIFAEYQIALPRLDLGTSRIASPLQ